MKFKSKQALSRMAVLVFMVSLATAGCKKFLDRKPLVGTISDFGGVEGKVLGIYNILNTYAGYNTLPWIDFNCIRGGDDLKGSSTTDGGEIVAEFQTYQYTKDDWATNTYWNDHYYMINKCNDVINDVYTKPLTDELSQKNLGEAYFFRAYSFFELVKAYGEVPLINYYYENAKEGIRPKSSVDSVFAQIDHDLDSATKLLPLTWAVGSSNKYPGRVTSGAANALWAQSYLFRNKWDKVIEKADLVINSGQYSLLPDFVTVWKDGVGGVGKNSKESIFEAQALIGSGGVPDIESPFGTSQNVRQGGAGPEWNLGWGWNVPSPKLVNDWDTTDPRKWATILYSGKSDGGPATGGNGSVLPPYNPGTALDQPYWNKKVYSDIDQRQATGHTTDGNAGWINHRIIRYADVLLMRAEAANEAGDGGTAATLLEQVRARARASAGNTNSAALPVIAFTSQAQMRQAIKDERRWEFAMEGYRFYDLVRWGDANAVLAADGYTDRCKYYPIPQPAIDISGGVLQQNPQW